MFSVYLALKGLDFGLSQIKRSDKTKGKAGSPIYMAPEMLLDHGYDEKADVYSFGIVLWEVHRQDLLLLTTKLYTQEEPYKGRFKTFEELVEGVTKHGIRPDIPADCPEKLKQLIQQCWNPSPENRPSFASILKSNILDEIMIDCVISEPNKVGREMWKKHFLEKASGQTN